MIFIKCLIIIGAICFHETVQQCYSKMPIFFMFFNFNIFNKLRCMYTVQYEKICEIKMDCDLSLLIFLLQRNSYLKNYRQYQQLSCQVKIRFWLRSRHDTAEYVG